MNVATRVGEGRPTSRLGRFNPYPVYKGSGAAWPREVPAHWDCVALSRVTISRCDGPFGSGLKSEHYTETGVRVIRLQNIGWASFTDGDTAFIDEVYARELGDHSVEPGDLLIAGLGDEGHPVGRACVAPSGLGPAMVKADCFRFRLQSQRAVPRFVAYQLSATAEAVAGSEATGATRTRVNLAATASRKVMIPPIQEQQAIVQFLDGQTVKIDALMAKKERLIELLQEKRTALITRAVTKGLAPTVPMKNSGVESLGKIPAYWEVMRLMFKTEHGHPVMYGIVLPGPHFEGGVPIVKGGDVTPKRLRRDLLRCTDPEIESGYERSRLRERDLVYAIRGSIGAVESVPGDVAGANITQDVAKVAPHASVCRSWLLYALRSSAVFAQLEAGALGATIQGINIRDLKRCRLPVPPRAEQEEIAGFCDAEVLRLARLTEKVRDGIEKLREYRAALISAAVTGKIDVREEMAAG